MTSLWQWFNYYEARVPAGKTLLRINVDETSIALYQGGNSGCIFFSKKRQFTEEEPVQRVPRAKLRGAFTHVAFICDRTDIQPLLPQVLVGNEKFFLRRDFETLYNEAPANVYLVRQKSAWNNTTLFISILTLLSRILAPFASQLQPCLIFDAAKCHLNPSIFEPVIGSRFGPCYVQHY